MNLRARFFTLSLGLLFACVLVVWSFSRFPKILRPLTFSISNSPTVQYITPSIQPLVEQGWELSERIRVTGLNYSFIFLKKPWFPTANSSTKIKNGTIARSWLVLASDDKEEFVLSLSDSGLNDSYETIIPISPSSGYWLRSLSSESGFFEIEIGLIDENGAFVSDQITLTWKEDIRRFQLNE